MKQPEEYGISTEFCIAMFLVGLIAIFYSMYLGGDLNKRLTAVESHVDTLAKMVQYEQYQIDVLTEYVKGQK